MTYYYKDKVKTYYTLTQWIQLFLSPRLTLTERKGILWLGDLLITCFGGVGALWLWTFTRPNAFTWEFFQTYAWWIPILASIWIFSTWILGLYDLQIATQILTVTPRIMAIVAFMSVAYLSIFFVFIAPSTMLPRLPLIYFLLLAMSGVWIWRWLYTITIGKGALQQRALIIGAGPAGYTLAKAMRAESEPHFKVLGFIDDAPSNEKAYLGNIPVVGKSEQLLEITKNLQIDTVVYAITHQLNPDIFHILLDCQAAGIPVLQMPTLYEALSGRVPVKHIRNDWLLPNKLGGGQGNLIYRLFIHFVDWVFGLLGGLVLLILGPIIALLIKLDSPGPIFYSQTRLGCGGKPFKLIKFRSMVTNAEEKNGAQWATKNDPRVTKIGRFLRRTRLDELPQIINILRGDIHLIGPRPERPEFIDQLEKDIPFYRARLIMRPGLTGWAQVKYRYGSSVNDSLVKLEYDLFYIRNRSVMLDITILLKTVGVILTFKGT